MLRPQHMFPSLATPENMTRNNVSATMFPSLARALKRKQSNYNLKVMVRRPQETTRLMREATSAVIKINRKCGAA